MSDKLCVECDHILIKRKDTHFAKCGATPINEEMAVAGQKKATLKNRAFFKYCSIVRRAYPECTFYSAKG